MVGARIDQLEPLLSRFSWTNGRQSDALCNFVLSSSAEFRLLGPKTDMGKLSYRTEFEPGVLSLGHQTAYVFCTRARTYKTDYRT